MAQTLGEGSDTPGSPPYACRNRRVRRGVTAHPHGCPYPARVSTWSPDRDGGLLLFRFRGVPVLLSPSWWIGSVAIIVLYAPLVDRFLPHATAVVSILLAAAFAILLGASVLLHELGHCVVALLLGSPVWRLRFFLFSGLAEITRTPRRPAHEGVIAAAG